MRKIAISILAILLFSTALPLASAVTETQFSDGSSTFTHVFSQTGDATTPGVTLPYGAEVSNVEIELEGSSSTQGWFNRTTDADFGGQGTTGSSQWGWSINQNGWNYGYRQNVKVDNDQLELRPTEDTTYWSMSNTNQAAASTGGSMNTTGQYFSSVEAGYNGMGDTTTTKSLSGGTWNYMGPVVKQGDEIHVVRYGSVGSYGGYQLSAINRYNATTGASIGTATIQYNNCSSNNVYYITDATSDGDGIVWMTSFYTSTSYAAITKWSVTYSTSSVGQISSTYKCEQSWTVLEVGGVSIDPTTNKMYVVQRVRLTSQYTIDLWEVSRSSPNIALQTWSLGVISPSGSQSNLNSYARPAGLDVQMPRISVNVYCYYYAYTYYCDADRVSWMNVYHQRSNWPELQAEWGSSYATMGIENIDGDLATTCMYGTVTSYCPSASTMRKIALRGQGSTDWMGTPTASNATITSSMQTLARSVSELSIGAAITWEPTGTSIDFEVTNDGGSTWKRASSAGQTITFTNAGNQLGWRAWLNGTASAAPLLDTVGLTYAATFASSGQWRTYRITSGAFPDAAIVWWNASTPGGSALDIYFRASSSCTSGTQVNVPSSGSTVTFSQMSGSYMSLCIDLDAGSSNQYTPTLYDINIALFEDAPQDVKIDIYDANPRANDGSGTSLNPGCSVGGYEWEHEGTLLGTTTAQSSSGSTDLEDAFNCIVPQSGTGTEVVGVKVHSSTPGKVEIKSMRIEYTMVTVNLDINFDENMVLHERGESYEIVTRHVIGDEALSITNAELTFIASPNSDAPKLSWAEDGTLVDDDPEDWIIPDQGGTWTNLSNGIFEIHWMFRVTDDFPEQNNVGWRISCTDDNGFSPATLSTSGAEIVVNQSYGLGWFAIHDVEGEVVNDDVQNGDWVVAGETIHFQGQVWFEGTQDAPLNSVFDIRVARKDSQGDFVSASWKDNSNPNGTFFISVAVPDMDIPEGVTFEVQAYNVRDPVKVMPINESWQRTLRIDDSSPEIINSWPADGDYEASSSNQQITVTVVDTVGQPESLTLNYWVEADHDTNRNGEPDEDEYATQTLSNSTIAEEKVFFGQIDDSRNPNMARVSYFISGHDPAGNLIIGTDGPGFAYDLSTYRTRKDMASVFTGLVWQDHVDGTDVYSGTDQSISIGLVDANGIIDFEYISLIFDFEGPDPERDQQRISYNGRTDSWSSESDYITLQQSSSAAVTTNDTGLPWIQTTFDFQFSWDWPDEDISDLALEYKELGSATPTRIEFIEHTFSVENDLVLDASTYVVEDVAEPRTGPLDDATPVRPDDRLRWSGRVVYESSGVPAPNDLGITVEVFDGVQYWSDGSLTDDGAFSIEVPLTAATTLQSAETRTFLTGVRNVPGRGEDMTRDTVATTLQLQVDHTPPRVHHRLTPVDVIDISAASDLTSLPVRFSGWEECVLLEDDDRCAAFSQSPQWVNWVMRDDTRTIAAGISPLAMQLNGTHLEWIGEVDLTSDGLVTPRSGYKVGFWVTGHDAAGNEFPMTANTESDPVREREDLDGDQDLAWVRLGATVAELIVKSLTLDQDTVSEGTEIEVVAIIANTGGMTESSFTVHFVTDEKVIDTVRITGLPSGGEHRITSTWTATEGIDRITVIVDAENEVVEVDEEGNSMSAGVSVEYSWGLGWVDSWRQNPLTVIGIIFALILIPVIAVVTWKTSLSGSTSLYDEELMYEDEEEDDWEDDDDDDDGWE